MNEKRMIDIDELREELGLAEQCENCKQNEWHCQRDCYYSLKDFCEKLDIAIETILERHKDTHGCIVEYDENGIPKCNVSLT